MADLYKKGSEMDLLTALTAASGDKFFCLDISTGVLKMMTADELAKAVGATLGTKVYRALLTQSGTDAPVATVLENTLGGTVVWAYSAAGIYTATLVGAFLSGKTFCLLNRGSVSINGLRWTRTSDDVLTIDTQGQGDSQMTSAALEIRVYP